MENPQRIQGSGEGLPGILIQEEEIYLAVYFFYTTKKRDKIQDISIDEIKEDHISLGKCCNCHIKAQLVWSIIGDIVNGGVERLRAFPRESPLRNP